MLKDIKILKNSAFKDNRGMLWTTWKKGARYGFLQQRAPDDKEEDGPDARWQDLPENVCRDTGSGKRSE